MPAELNADLEEDFPPIAGRTLLFGLEPIAVGTGQCEGLTSYLVRLAKEHSVPMRRLVSRMLFDGVRPPRCDAKFFRQYAATINGLGAYAERFAQAVGLATGRRDLEFLTMRLWRGLLASNGSELTCRWRRWCSACLTSSEAYWPLVWSIASVKSCGQHGLSLVERCPSCFRRQPAIPRIAELDRCDFCAQSLGGGLAVSASYEADRRGARELVEQLIALSPSVSADSIHERWTEGLSKLIATERLDRASLCRRVGLNPRAMNAWFNRGTRVSLESLTKVCLGLQVTPLAILQGTVSATAATASGCESSVVRPPRRRRHAPETRLLALSRLSESIRADNPPTLQQLAEQLGVSTGFLRYWHPDMVARLRLLRREQTQEQRAARIQRHRHEVAATVMAMRAEGLAPGRKRVEAAIRAKGASLIQPANLAAYRAACAGEAPRPE